MPGVIFRNESGNIHGQILTCEIIDNSAGADDPVDFNIRAPGWVVSVDGDKFNPFHYIYPMYAKGNMILTGEEHLAFFENMKTGEEGRYFLKVAKDEVILFIGKIIIEDMRLDDVFEPTFYFSAIDGITDLKGIDFEHYLDVTIQGPVLHIFKSIFDLMPTKDYFPSGGPAWGFQSDIVPDVAVYDGNLMEVTYVNNYFYKKENTKRTKMTCYEVLEEMLKRLHCSLKYYGSIFWITGHEGIFSTRITDVHYYAANSSYVASSVIMPDSLNITPKALYGGNYYYSSGYNRVTIEADKIFSNRKSGDGVFWNLAYFTAMTGLYKDIGIAKNGIEYKVRININITSVIKSNPSQSIPPFFSVKLNMGVVGGAAIETDKKYLIPTTPGKYFYELKVASDGSDREIEAKWEIETIPTPNNLTKIELIIEQSMTEVTQIYDKIKTISTITGSKNPKTKTISIYGNHHNGTEAVRWYYGTGASDFEETKVFSFSGGGSNGYEALLSENILSYLGNIETLEIGYNDVIDPYPFGEYTYAGNTYMLAGYNLHVHEGKSDLILIKKNDPQTGISTEQEVPLESDFNEPTSSIIGNIQLYVQLYHEEFENVTASYISPTTDLSEYFTGDVDEIKKGRMVWMNGVKQQYKDVAVVSYPPDPGELNLMQWTYFAATNRFYFGQPLEDCYVEFRFSNV